MKRERIVEFVGGSEEEVAYLRLLLRKAAGQLSDKWRLRRESDGHVDLLIIHDIDESGATPSSSLGADSAARVRLIDPVFGAAGMEIALWPLSQDKLARLFNLTSFAADEVRTTAQPLIQHNIYDELFESEVADRWQALGDARVQAPLIGFDDDWAPPPAMDSELMRQAEDLFKREDVALQKEALKSIRLHADVDIEATDGDTEVGGARKDRRVGTGILADTRHTLTIEEAGLRYPLAAYLKGGLLPVPSRIEVGPVALTLDPRNRLYYAKGALCIFDECCKQQIRRGDWRGLSSFEFAEIKKQCEARPFSELIWLCSYINDSTRPAIALGDDSRYRLSESLELQRDFPRAARVARELEKGSTLTAAANIARVPLAEARRVACAFDAVGMLLRE